jgi:ATP-binding cassette subfamily B protein
VTFAYEGRDVQVFDGLNLSIAPGTIIGVVGASGSGKSTLASLLFRCVYAISACMFHCAADLIALCATRRRLYDVSSGSVSIDGHDLRGLDPQWLRQHISVVSQEPLLFSGTIAENIAYGRPAASAEEISMYGSRRVCQLSVSMPFLRLCCASDCHWIFLKKNNLFIRVRLAVEAARKANAHDFIEQFPDGYATMVGERGQSLSGASVSERPKAVWSRHPTGGPFFAWKEADPLAPVAGGQRQRIAIARALLLNTKIVILDEATSSLDSESERLVQEALEKCVRRFWYLGSNTAFCCSYGGYFKRLEKQKCLSLRLAAGICSSTERSSQ